MKVAAEILEEAAPDYLGDLLLPLQVMGSHLDLATGPVAIEEIEDLVDEASGDLEVRRMRPVFPGCKVADELQEGSPQVLIVRTDNALDLIRAFNRESLASLPDSSTARA